MSGEIEGEGERKKDRERGRVGTNLFSDQIFEKWRVRNDLRGSRVTNLKNREKERNSQRKEREGKKSTEKGERSLVLFLVNSQL